MPSCLYYTLSLSKKMGMISFRCMHDNTVHDYSKHLPLTDRAQCNIKLPLTDRARCNIKLPLTDQARCNIKLRLTDRARCNIKPPLTDRAQCNIKIGNLL